MASENPLISAHKADAGALQVNLHPLVILTISDYITRHTLRQQKGPIVGAILGQQNGREITLEYAFESQLVQDPNDQGALSLDAEKFEERLQQCMSTGFDSSGLWHGQD
jgi:COP9 signalosome complex subunit 6